MNMSFFCCCCIKNKEERKKKRIIKFDLLFFIMKLLFIIIKGIIIIRDTFIRERKSLLFVCVANFYYQQDLFSLFSCMKIEVLYFFTSQYLLHIKTSLSAAYTYEKKNCHTKNAKQLKITIYKNRYFFFFLLFPFNQDRKKE